MDTIAITPIGPPRLHKLKCEAPYFGQVMLGSKLCEVRLNDRNYQVNDYLLLRELLVNIDRSMPNDPQPTGNEVLVRITHILAGGQNGIDSQYVVLSIELIAEVPTR